MSEREREGESDYHTSDHIYTLHTLIERHVTQNFKQAFHSVWHTGLFDKVIERGVGGKTYDLIKSVSSKCTTKIGSNKKKNHNSSSRAYLYKQNGIIEKSTAPGLTLHNSETLPYPTLHYRPGSPVTH